MAPGHCLTCGGCSQPQPTRMAQYATGTPVDLRLCKGFSRGSRVQMDLQQPVISEGKGGADGAACQESASLGSVLCPNTRAESVKASLVAPLIGSDDAEGRRAASRRCGGCAQSCRWHWSLDRGRSDPCWRHQQGSCGPVSRVSVRNRGRSCGLAHQNICRFFFYGLSVFPA